MSKNKDLRQLARYANDFYGVPGHVFQNNPLGHDMEIGRISANLDFIVEQPGHGLIFLNNDERGHEIFKTVLPDMDASEILSGEDCSVLLFMQDGGVPLFMTSPLLEDEEDENEAGVEKLYVPITRITEAQFLYQSVLQTMGVKTIFLGEANLVIDGESQPAGGRPSKNSFVAVDFKPLPGYEKYLEPGLNFFEVGDEQKT